MRTTLREGQRVRAPRAVTSYLSPEAAAAGEIGVVEGIGPVWDWPEDQIYVGVKMDSGAYVALPLDFANSFWRPVKKWPHTTTPLQQ